MATIQWALADILHEKNMSQRELSRQTSITREAVSRMVRGKTVRAELPIIAKLVDTLGVPLSAILVQTPPAPQQKVTPAPTPAPATPAAQPAQQTGRDVRYALTGDRWPATTPEEQAEDHARRQSRSTTPPVVPPADTPPAVCADEDEEEDFEDGLGELLAKLTEDSTVWLNAAERALVRKYDIDVDVDFL